MAVLPRRGTAIKSPSKPDLNPILRGRYAIARALSRDVQPTQAYLPFAECTDMASVY